MVLRLYLLSWQSSITIAASFACTIDLPLCLLIVLGLDIYALPLLLLVRMRLQLRVGARIVVVP